MFSEKSNVTSHITLQSSPNTKQCPIILLCAALLLFFLLSIAIHAEVIFNDDFWDLDYTNNPTWIVDNGVFAADGINIGNYQPTPAELNFGRDSGTRIHPDLGQTLVNTPFRISYKLRQSDGTANSYLFQTIIEDTVTGVSYTCSASCNPGYFGISGFHSYNNSGQLIAGTEGIALYPLGWQTMTFTFDPSTGIIIEQDGVIAAEWPNFNDLIRINRISFESEGTVSWFVDDVVIETLPFGPHYCGDEGTVYHEGDISGPDGQPDCLINLYDLSFLAARWLDCADPHEATCANPHETTNRNADAIQTVYRNGVPHTTATGIQRMTYDPAESFFPIGSWGAPMPGLNYGNTYDWQTLVDAGFNVVWPWHFFTDVMTTLQAGQDAGLQIIFMQPRSVQELQQIAGHPNLLGNMWADEPTGNFWGDDMQGHFDDFLAYMDTAHAIDPNMLIFVNDVPWITEPATNWWIAWNTSGDISCHDNYPIRPVTNTIGADPQGIPQVVSFAVDNNNEQKPVWLIVGTFTSRISPNSGFSFRFPTPAQLRAQVYAGIIHGATGITYFAWDSYVCRDGAVIGSSPDPQIAYVPNPQQLGYPHPTPATPEELAQSLALWETTTQVNSELNELTPVILSPTVGTAFPYYVTIQGTAVTDAPIRTLLKPHPETGYVLLTANLDNTGLTVSYTFTSELTSVEPLFENREPLAVSPGSLTFTEEYEPYATHVYHITTF